MLKSDKPVLVDFWAEWCAPCRMMAPAVEAIAEEYAGRAKVGKLNVDENQSVTGRYNIRGIPTLLVFKNGQVQEQYVGVHVKDTIVKLLGSTSKFWSAGPVPRGRASPSRPPGSVMGRTIQHDPETRIGQTECLDERASRMLCQ